MYPSFRINCLWGTHAPNHNMKLDPKVIGRFEIPWILFHIWPHLLKEWGFIPSFPTFNNDIHQQICRIMTFVSNSEREILTNMRFIVTFSFRYHHITLIWDPRYPQFTPVLIRALELWYHDPNVTTPVLKLMTELMQNRSQRLHFGVSSPNGILLFRECSKVLVAYGKLTVVLYAVSFYPEVEKHSKLPHRYKICYH